MAFTKKPLNPDALHLYCIAQRRGQEILLVISKGSAEDALRQANDEGFSIADWALGTTFTRRINRNMEGPPRVIARLSCLPFRGQLTTHIGGE